MNKSPYYRSSRKRGVGTGRVFTLNKEMIKKLEKSNPYSVCLFLFLLDNHLKYRDKDNIIDGIQQMELNDKFLILINSHKPSSEFHFIERWFRDGIRMMDMDLFSLIDQLNLFYQMICPFENGKFI